MSLWGIYNSPIGVPVCIVMLLLVLEKRGVSDILDAQTILDGVETAASTQDNWGDKTPMF